MSDSESMTVTRTVDAGPAEIFAALADPARHTELDGSGLLRGLVEGSTLTGVGDEFVLDMHNSILGDYQIRNVVTSYKQDREIGWAPHLHPDGAYADKLGDMKPGGHTYTWILEPAGEGTKVTQVYDWSKVGDPGFKALFPMLGEEALATSIEKVGQKA